MSARKKVEEPTLAGWLYCKFVMNMCIFCKECKARNKEMFCRSIKDDGMSWHRTESICVPCAKK